MKSILRVIDLFLWLKEDAVGPFTSDLYRSDYHPYRMTLWTNHSKYGSHNPGHMQVWKVFE